MAIIDKPSDYFNTKLYTGNGGTNAITGVGFSPSLVWAKARNNAYSNTFYDVVRGVTKRLYSNLNYAENTEANSLTAFGSDGFTLGSDGGSNVNSGTFVAWNWKAGTAFTNDASATGIGTIDSTGSVNTDAGFSIISYTGNGGNATVGHGLGATPKIVIIKNRDRVSGWHVGGDAIGSVNQYLNLNNTDAIASATTGFQSFSSTTFGIGTDTDWNASSESIIAYCFAEKQGYSKFSSFVGNGNDNGSYIHLGFSPALVILKQSSASGQSWQMADNRRKGYNPNGWYLRANSADSEESSTTHSQMDLLSSGFKLLTSHAQHNASGATYIYMAFAENPFVTSTGVPATAR